MGDLKFVVPKMKETFGNLAYAGKGKVIPKGQRVNGVEQTPGRVYHLYSDRQRADNIEVIIPLSVPDKSFEYDEPVELVNPRLELSPYSIGRNGISDYCMMADNIVKAGKTE